MLKQLRAAEKSVDTNPTPAQAEAGNYAHGHLRMLGFDVSIENPKDSIRRGTDKSGKDWEVKLKHSYGYIRGTTGADDDHLDCFIGDHPESELIYVIDQHIDGEFDEHKLVFGAVSEEDAREVYLSNYEKGWKGLKHITPLTKAQLRSWVDNGDQTKKLKGQKMNFHKRAGISAPVASNIEGVLNTASTVTDLTNKAAPVVRAAPWEDEQEKSAAYVPVENAFEKAAAAWQEMRKSGTVGMVEPVRRPRVATGKIPMNWDAEPRPTAPGKAPGAEINLMDSKSTVNPADFKMPYYGDQFPAQLEQAAQYNLKNKLPNTTDGWQRPVTVVTRNPTSNSQYAPFVRQGIHGNAVFMPADAGKFLRSQAPEMVAAGAKPADALAHEVNHAAGENWAAGEHDDAYFVGSTKDPGYAGRQNFMDRLPHDLIPGEHRGYMSTIQAQMFKDTGSRITSPEAYDKWLESMNVHHADPAVFENSIKSVPVDAQRMLRGMRDPAADPAYLKSLKQWQRRVMPGIVQQAAPMQEKYAAGMLPGLAMDAVGMVLLPQALHKEEPPPAKGVSTAEQVSRDSDLISGHLTRYTYGGKGAWMAAKEKMPSLAGDVADAIERARARFKKPELPEGEYRSYFTPKGDALYQETLLPLHEQVLGEGIEKETAEPEAGDVPAYEDEHQKIYPVKQWSAKDQEDLEDASKSAAMKCPECGASAKFKKLGDAIKCSECEKTSDIDARFTKKSTFWSLDNSPLSMQEAVKTAFADMRFTEIIAEDDDETEKNASLLQELKIAKEHSDRGDYKTKAGIIRGLMVSHGDEFDVEPSDEGSHVVGITHRPTGFRMHIPRTEIPPAKLQSEPEHLISYVPEPALEAIRKHGLLSGNELAKPENRHLLNLARSADDGDGAEGWLARRAQALKDKPWNTSYSGPSAMFGPPDEGKLHDKHPTKRFKSVPVRIRLAQLLAKHPGTKLHGSELVPFNEKYDTMSEEEKDKHVQERHHDLTPKEISALIQRAKNPKEMWQHYNDPEGKTYSGNVPHAHVITPHGKIDPEFLEFPDAEKSAGLSPEQAVLAKVRKHLDKAGLAYHVVVETPGKGGASMHKAIGRDEGHSGSIVHAREAHVAWEKEHGHDPDEDWEKSALHWSKDLTRDIMGGRNYPVSYLTGEIGELGHAIKNLDWENVKEEFGDSAYAAQMLIAQRTGLNLPVLGANAQIKKFYDRIERWKKIFGDQNIPFSVDHLSGGSNYAKPEKIQKAFASAGHQMSPEEAAAISQAETVTDTDEFLTPEIVKHAADQWDKLREELKPDPQMPIIPIPGLRNAMFVPKENFQQDQPIEGLSPDIHALAKAHGLIGYDPRPEFNNESVMRHEMGHSKMWDHDWAHKLRGAGQALSGWSQLLAMPLGALLHKRSPLLAPALTGGGTATGFIPTIAGEYHADSAGNTSTADPIIGNFRKTYWNAAGFNTALSAMMATAGRGTAKLVNALMHKVASARPVNVPSRDKLPFRESAEAILRDGDDLVGILAAGHGGKKFLKFPGGGIDEGESIHQGLEREMMEEAGVTGHSLTGHGHSQIVWHPDMEQHKPEKYAQFQGSRRHVFSGWLKSSGKPTSKEGDELTGSMRIPISKAVAHLQDQIAHPENDADGGMLRHRFLQLAAIHELMDSQHEKVAMVGGIAKAVGAVAPRVSKFDSIIAKITKGLKWNKIENPISTTQALHSVPNAPSTLWRGHDWINPEQISKRNWTNTPGPWNTSPYKGYVHATPIAEEAAKFGAGFGLKGKMPKRDYEIPSTQMKMVSQYSAKPDALYGQGQAIRDNKLRTWQQIRSEEPAAMAGSHVYETPIAPGTAPVNTGFMHTDASGNRYYAPVSHMPEWGQLRKEVGDSQELMREMQYSDAWHSAMDHFNGGIKAAAVAKAIPTTGPEALAYHLSRINLDDLEAQNHALVKSGKVSKRDQAVKILNIVEGMRRNELHPRELMINHVPVIPAAFRPYSLAGSSFIPGNANELYRDLFTNRKVYDEAKRELGPEGEGEAAHNLYNAVRAVYGFGEPVNDKARARGVTGFFEQITGSSPKFGYAQRRLLSKPVDNVGRATITINPDLGLDEIGIPREMAWDIFDTKLHRHLVRKGFSPADAALSLRDRDDHAKRALEDVVPNHPVQYSRAPAWHQFSTLGAMPKLFDGNTIQINPYVTAGLNADFDGDAINVHAPTSEEVLKETRDILMPSKMLFTIRDQDKVMPTIKHESLLALHNAGARAPVKVWNFPSHAEALAAVRKGTVPLHDSIVFPGSEEMEMQTQGLPPVVK